MTLVRFYRTRPSPGGVNVPVGGVLRFTPTRRRVIEGDPDQLVLPVGFIVEVPKETGRADVELAPSDPGWVWEIYAYGFGVASSYEYVIVPEPVPDPDDPDGFLPVDETDLVRVDKGSLDPVADPDPAWWAELVAVKATAADVEDARVEVAGNAVVVREAVEGLPALIDTRATEAVGSAVVELVDPKVGEASAAAVAAVTARGEAQGFAEAAGVSADAAGGSAGRAAASESEAKGAATTASAAATAADGAASSASASASQASESATAAAGSATTAQNAATGATNSASQALSIAQSVRDDADAGLFKGDPGKDGAPGNATMRVDTSVGKRVFISDGTTEHMISGKVSRKLTTPDYINGWAVDLIGLGIYLSRIDDLVTLEIPSRGLTGASATSNLWLALPAGFRKASGIGNYGIFGYLADGTLPVSLSFDRDSLSLSTRGIPNGMIQWRTTDPWPTTLPGTPA